MTLAEGLQEGARRGLTRARVGERWMPLTEVPRLVDTGEAPVELLERPHAVVLRLPGGLSVRLAA